MATSDTTAARDPDRAIAAPAPDSGRAAPADGALARDGRAPGRPIGTDRFEVCPECAALVAGDRAPPGRSDPDELREIERGVARLSASRGELRATLSVTGERVGHRATPCACCRRPVSGERAVLERVVTDLAGVEELG